MFYVKIAMSILNTDFNPLKSNKVFIYDSEINKEINYQ